MTHLVCAFQSILRVFCGDTDGGWEGSWAQGSLMKLPNGFIGRWDVLGWRVLVLLF